jgi:hypothetical protein
LESRDNYIIKDLNRAWIELESRIDSTPWGKLADELLCDALAIQAEFGDGEELLHLLRDYIKRVDNYEESLRKSDGESMEDFEKSLTPSERRRLAHINEANRIAAREAMARGENNFLVKAYLREQPNPWATRCNSSVPRVREFRSAPRPTFTQNGGGGSGDDDGDSDQPDPDLHCQVKLNSSFLSRRRIDDCCSVSKSRCAA